MACRWQRNQLIADEEFTRAWTPYIWKRARAWCKRHHLPDHQVEEYVSAGFAALACVPAENRWSSKYVMTAIRNRMFSAARRRQGQPHPESVINVDTLRDLSSSETEDAMIGKLDIERAIEALAPAFRDVVRMQIAGLTIEEIARDLRLDDATEIVASADALLRAALEKVSVN